MLYLIVVTDVKYKTLGDAVGVGLLRRHATDRYLTQLWKILTLIKIACRDKIMHRSLKLLKFLMASSWMLSILFGKRKEMMNLGRVCGVR